MAWRSVIAVGQVIRQYGLASEILTPGEEFGSGRKSMGDLIVKLITRYIQMYFIFYFPNCSRSVRVLHAICMRGPTSIHPSALTYTASVLIHRSYVQPCFQAYNRYCWLVISTSVSRSHRRNWFLDLLCILVDQHSRHKRVTDCTMKRQ